MSDAGDFIDAALQYEVSPYVYTAEEPDGLVHYGTSVGAVRGTVRDAIKRHPGMTHDDITALSSELWSQPVYERRRAAIVLLQTYVHLLVVGDLTRFEGFIRSAGSTALVERLAADVIVPMLGALSPTPGARAAVVVRRWAGESDAGLRQVALLLDRSPSREQ